MTRAFGTCIIFYFSHDIFWGIKDEVVHHTMGPLLIPANFVDQKVDIFIRKLHDAGDQA